ncbi:MAG TPA: hypothetical protein VEB21_16750 [Terriglobales bacterium]|nr:hypothetical protein [Terriglobales bacterium]
MPRTDCVRAGISSIAIRHDPSGARSRLDWKWLRGGATSLADLGNPGQSGGTGYALCLYDEVDGVAELIISARVPAGEQCAGRPCWQTSSRGAKYRYLGGNADSISDLKVQSGDIGRTAIKLRAAGPRLALAPVAATQLLHQAPGLVIQLVNDLQPPGRCWSSRFAAPNTRHDATQFKDKERAE